MTFSPMFRLRPTLSVLMIVMAVLAGGCSGKAATPPTIATITVAALPALDDAGLFVAQRHRLFEAQHLRVRITTYQQSTQAIPALQKGDVKIVFGNYVTFFQGQAQGALDVRLVAEGSVAKTGTLSVVAMPNSKIQTIADLPGRTVAINVLNNFQSLTLNAVARANNVNPAKIKYVAVPLPQVAAALQQGKVDAGYLGEPFLTDAQMKLGSRVVADPVSGPTSSWPISGYFATRQWASANPDVVQRFAKALSQGQQLATNRAEVQAAVNDPKYTKIPPVVAAVMAIPDYPPGVNAVRLQRVADQMNNAGLIKTRLNIAQLIAPPVASTSPSAPPS